MQESCEDYYELCEMGQEDGCCLVCPEAHEGCLCYKCKCKKCYWYSEGYGKGSCDKKEELQEIKKKEAREWYSRKQELENKKWREETKKLEKSNEKKEKEIKVRNEIPSWYSCQRCKRDFVTDEELKIIQNKTPICKVCLGEE